LNPIHNGHIDILERAKRFLESEHGYLVVGGFISPSHDLYVGPKCKNLKTLFFPASDRVRLAQLACKSSDWIECGLWESQQAGDWPDFPEVLDNLHKHLDKTFPDPSGAPLFTTLYVCGRDHADKCGLHGGFRFARQGVVIVPRSGDPPAATNPERLVYGVTETNPAVEHLSSTAVRNALVAGQPLPPDWLPLPAAAELARLFAERAGPAT
jgi:hypothetical protein